MPKQLAELAILEAFKKDTERMTKATSEILAAMEKIDKLRKIREEKEAR